MGYTASLPSAGCSLSITHWTADLQILTPPPAPHPPMVQLNTDPYPCWYSLPWHIGSGFPSLCQILRPSWLHLYSVRGRLMLLLAPKPRLTTLRSGLNMTVVPTGSPLIGTMNTPMWIAHLTFNFTTPNSFSGWGHRNLPACSAGPRRVAPGHVLGANHTRCAPAPA